MRHCCWLALLLPVAGFGDDLPRYVPTPAELKQAYADADRMVADWSGKALNTSLTPHRLPGEKALWYREDSAGGKREFWISEWSPSQTSPAFNAERLVKAVAAAGGPKLDAERLPFDDIEFVGGRAKVRFKLGKDAWVYNAAKDTAAKEGTPHKQVDAPPKSPEDEELDASQTGAPKGPPRGLRPTTVTSPDGRWTVTQKSNNLLLKPKDGDEQPLTTDGTPERFYGNVSWSPDSTRLVAYKTAPGDNKEVWYVESSPKDGGRAKLHSHVYPQPGDKFPVYEGWTFDPATRKGTKIEADPVDFRMPRPRWIEQDKTKFTYEKTDRGHQRFRIIEVDAATGKTRTLYDDQAKTFVNQYANFTLIYNDDAREAVVSSERDGWNHLYLIDLKAGKVRNQITKGEHVVRGVEYADFAKRTLVVRACGVFRDTDPYFTHFYRVNFDGTAVVTLTHGIGTHTLQWSPDRSYFLDTWSRVDFPPIHEVCDGSDGKLLTSVLQADVSALKGTPWKTPEVFTAKGRDGKTDIWGIITRPSNFDPKKKYPVIEYIYAGPHDSFVPKSFRAAHGRQALAEFGFIVVQCDGMGTLNRSKAFHDVCWQNVGDAGFPDRIAWIKAAAAKYPQLDTARVGIYGTSAGGQSSTGALLFHGDFYKVAVSSCGCHDNRVDKASWNEQWMGVPVGPHYAVQSNVTNAHKLTGKLMLIVGEMDTNVPPESTYRLADALIKAKKDFDFLMVPGMGHSDGGSYGERRRRDFFVRHLHGVETPDWNR